MGILSYIKLAGAAFIVAVCMYFYYDYKGAKQDVIDLQVKNASAVERIERADEKLRTTIAGHNIKFGKLQKSFYEERETRKLMEKNFTVANEKIAGLLNDAEEEKQKYEDGRLARIATAKGGLLTRLARKGANKRNEDWEALAQ